MDTKTVGRLTGTLLLIHLAGGLILPYVLLQPVFAPPGFLENAAAHAARMRAAVFRLFMSGAITVTVSLTALPVLRRCSERLATLLVALAAVNLALHAVENGTLLSLLSLSQEHVRQGASHASLFEGLAVAAGTARRWAHFTHLLVVGNWLFTLFVVLWRSAQVPRLIAGAGMAAAVLQLAGVPLRAILGLDIITALAIPLAPACLAVAAWLVFTGFRERA